MAIKKMDISTIVESPFNPRKIDAKTLEKLVASIREFGYVDPMIVNKRNNQVVGGNQRLKALRTLGFKDVQIVLIDVDEQKEKALNVALNKISGDWDFNKLRDIMTQIGDEDKILTGFDASEIDILLQSFGGDEQLMTPAPPDELSGGEGCESNFGSGQQSETGATTPGSDGVSYVVYVSFPTQEGAENWLKGQGVDHKFKPKNKTFVLRMGVNGEPLK
jgi:hypothetical protein